MEKKNGKCRALYTFGKSRPKKFAFQPGLALVTGLQWYMNRKLIFANFMLTHVNVTLHNFLSWAGIKGKAN
jgi:hypothetical protein